jgi:hypothetical protein
MWDWVLPAYRVMGRSDPEYAYWLRRPARSAAVAAPSPMNHHSAVTTEVTRATGSTTTAYAASSHSPGSDAAAACFGLGRWPAPAPPAGEPTLAIRHRSRSANHRAGARAPATTGDPPGNTKPAVATHRPPNASSRPAAAITGAVSRYSDSASVRRPVRKRNLAPGRHRPWTAEANDSVMTPA